MCDFLVRAAIIFSLAGGAAACSSDDGDESSSDDVGTHDALPETDATDALDGDAEDVDPSDSGTSDAPTTDTGPGDTRVSDTADAADAAEDDVGSYPLPDALPWTFTRPEAGTAPSDEEIATFTGQITGLWRDSQYFRWVRMTSHGVDPSNTEGWPDYALWWQDTRTIRDGDTVIFEHHGRADNLTLRSTKVLANAIAGYLMTGDEHMRWIVEQYSKGIAALAMAMHFEEDDEAPYLQARAVFTRNHEYETVDGRRVRIDYDPVRRHEEAWNAAIIHNPTNPYWGDIWYVNQRSKDDLPHMYRAVPMLLRAVEEAPDESVREAATLALEYLSGFARDVVDSGYQIRTKYGDGAPVVPTLENGAVKDLASLVMFEDLVPNAECNGKLASALIGYGSPLDNDCEQGDGGAFEQVAANRHYFNYAIIRYFHIAAVHNALMLGENEEALELMEGLAARADAILHDESLPHRDNAVWRSDAAAFLLASAAAGLPLTGEEARLVQEEYALSAEHYGAFGAWDPWSDEIADGPFEYKPDRGTAVRPTEISYLLEYCYSPLRNPAGAAVVDCEIVEDPARWGEGREADE